MSQKTKPICTHCGSPDIICDAYAEWDSETQSWVLASTYDDTHCRDCDGECSTEWITADQPAVSEWERLARAHGWEQDKRTGAQTRGSVTVYGWRDACRADNLTDDDFLEDEAA